MVTDQSICTRILRIANTTFYRGNREKVTDANEAIGALGFDKIKDVILTTSVFKVFAGKESAEQRFSLEGLWKHSMGVAAASRAIAKYLGRSWHETAYTCGLVHDIGKVARFKLDEDNNDNLFLRDSQTALDQEINFFQAELSNGSPRHDYLGYLICRHWGLSGAVEGVVRWHHEPNPDKRQKVRLDSDTSDLIDLVIVANWIVNDLSSASVDMKLRTPFRCPWPAFASITSTRLSRTCRSELERLKISAGILENVQLEPFSHSFLRCFLGKGSR